MLEVPGEPDPQIWKKQFSRVLSHELYWKNKTYKLKRSIIGAFDCGFNISIQMWEAVDPYEPRYMFLSHILLCPAFALCKELLAGLGVL